MSLLVETIKLKNGIFYNLDYHNKRFNRSRFELFRIKKEIDLIDILQTTNYPTSGLFKTRIIYDEKIVKIEFEEYQIKHIEKLKMVVNNNITYPYKFLNRQAFDTIKKNLSKNEEAIIVKNGFITDTTFSNLAFYDGQNWFTPKTYLLNGTKRQFYIDKKLLLESTITLHDLRKFLKVSLINTMLDIAEIEISTKNILLSKQNSV
ncbi:aminotransferase class IV [Deferribacter abyssi]|uniref:aminotransferase class IV n=1 Tax=Deferribacter abyssi TaxID=213806 RepID=UPI003C1C1CB4